MRVSYDTTLQAVDCEFTDNESVLALGGAVHVTDYASVTFINALFARNQAGHHGGALSSLAANTVFTHCQFLDNRTPRRGGAVYAADESQVTTNNCLFARNTADLSGGAVHVGSDSELSVAQCTFSENVAVVEGGGINIGAAALDVSVSGSILWRDKPDEIAWRGSGFAITFSNIEGGWAGVGNIDDDPLFVGGPSGTWTGDATYDGDADLTTFTDSAADWTPDSLAGKYLLPNIPLDPNSPDAYQLLLIESNTSTTIDVWGDFASLGTTGASYQVDDFHLLPDSPCIDAGDNTAVPSDTLDLDGDGDTTERIPVDLDWRLRFADRQDTTDTGVADPPDYPYVVDMGAYEYQCTGDLDGDGEVGLSDLAQLLANYGTTGGMTYEDGDLDDDGDVDLSDLAALLAVYGTSCP
jgi:predicted outer membrane repeat protein